MVSLRVPDAAIGPGSGAIRGGFGSGRAQPWADAVEAILSSRAISAPDPRDRESRKWFGCGVRSRLGLFRSDAGPQLFEPVEDNVVMRRRRRLLQQEHEMLAV